MVVDAKQFRHRQCYIVQTKYYPRIQIMVVRPFLGDVLVGDYYSMERFPDDDDNFHGRFRDDPTRST